MWRQNACWSGQKWILVGTCIMGLRLFRIAHCIIHKLQVDSFNTVGRIQDSEKKYSPFVFEAFLQADSQLLNSEKKVCTNDFEFHWWLWTVRKWVKQLFFINSYCANIFNEIVVGNIFISLLSFWKLSMMVKYSALCFFPSVTLTFARP